MTEKVKILSKKKNNKLLKHFAADLKGQQFLKVQHSLFRLGANLVSPHVPLHPIGFPFIKVTETELRETTSLKSIHISIVFNGFRRRFDLSHQLI